MLGDGFPFFGDEESETLFKFLKGKTNSVLTNAEFRKYQKLSFPRKYENIETKNTWDIANVLDNNGTNYILPLVV